MDTDKKTSTKETVIGLVILTIIGLVAFSACTAGGDDRPTAAQLRDTTRLDQEGDLACWDFSKYVSDGQPISTRVATVDKIYSFAHRSRTNNIATSAGYLRNAQSRNDQSWKLAADSFAYACTTAGYGKDK